jgi:NAD(P)-dependent dehydrogenase (short-subunit alcohol dehydrogenase family)
MKRVLVTGSGTGFGHEAAMRLAEKGFDVIAAVEIYGQVQTLKRQAAARNVSLQFEKLETKRLIDAPWTKKVTDGLGTRPASLQKSYEMKPETPVAE